MDYAQRLDKSIDNFEREAGKLTQVVRLIDETAKLIAEARAGRETLQQSSARLSKMSAQITADCQTLANFSAKEESARRKLLAEIHALVTEDTAQAVENLSQPLNAAHENLTRTAEAFAKSVAEAGAAFEQNANANEQFHAELSENLLEYIRAETEARQKLVADIHSTVAGDARKIVDEISAPLNQSNAELTQTRAQIAKFIETHKNSQAAFLAEIEALLIRYNAKNIDVYNSITGVVTNRLDVAQNSVETRLAKQDAAIENHVLSLNNKIQALTDALQNVSGNLRDTASVLRYIKIAVTIAMGTGIISCAAQFLAK